MSNKHPTFSTQPDPLTKAQLSELQQLRDEAAATMRKADPSLEYSLAGMSLSNGGHEKVLGVLNTFFEQFQEAAIQMSEEFSLSISTETLASVDSTATAYLFADLFRPRGGWSLSAKKRESIDEYNTEMDRRAWMAALYLKLARSFLRT
jgi:hypothetical protein